MTENSKKTPPHWLDKLTTDLIANWPEVESYNCNCGISVSGMQHVGRLRGEIVLTNAVVNELKTRGYSATHYLILYTADPWKGKSAQLNSFTDPEVAKKYIDWRLIDVPDPTGQHSSWVDYFWKDFGDPLSQFSTPIEIIRTHEFYQREEMKKAIIELIENKEKVRTILNKYRKEKPFPEDWIPFNPLCNDCNRIGTTTALEVNLKEYIVRYYCKACQKEGWSDMKVGKLTWRLEWLAIWYVLNVHFEPYGKDHATPGGSRDSCIEVLNTILHHPGPYGFWNEWVGFSEGRTDYGDMTSSGFIGFTPTTWLRYAEPEVLRYIYLKPPPKRRIVLGLDKIPNYIAEFDKVQRVYFGIETFEDDSELHTIRRSYEITFYDDVPKYTGFQLDYSHAIILSQLVSADQEGTTQAIQKLQATGILTVPINKELENYIHNRLMRARNWVLEQAPPHYRINIPDNVTLDFIQKLDSKMIEQVNELKSALTLVNWTEEEIKESMISLREKFGLSRKDMNQFFGVLYQIFLGTPRGPRLAPFLAALDKKWVIERLQEINKS
ncbi:MAG: lysine--tRNA ligase [Candidatus Hodarchaeota archaeon]